MSELEATSVWLLQVKIHSYLAFRALELLYSVMTVFLITYCEQNKVAVISAFCDLKEVCGKS